MPGRSHQAGISLIGVLFAIVIGLLVMGALYGLSHRTTTAAKAQSDAQALLSIRQGIHSIFPSGDYSSLTNALLIKANQVPEALVYGATLLRGAAGEAIDVAPAIREFRVRVFTTSAASCTTLASTAQGAFRRVVVAGVTVKDDSTPFDNAATTGACKSGHATVEFYDR